MIKKITFLITISLCVTGTIQAQSSLLKPTMTKVGIAAPLRPISDFLEAQHNSALEWELVFGLNSKAVMVKNAASVSRDFDTAFRVFADTTRGGKQLETLIAALDYGAIDSILRSLPSSTYFFSSPSELPVRFMVKDTDLVFVLSVVTDKQLNTLRLTSKQRASEILTQVLLPSLRALKPLFTHMSIKYYGLSVVYGSKDFSDEDGHGQGEVLTLLATNKNCQQFVSGELADQDLLINSDIYSTDRDTHTGFKKIRVTLE